MNKIKRNLLKHISLIFLIGFALFFLWAFGLYAFLCNYIRNEELPAVEQSKVLSQVSSGSIYIPKIRPSAKELEKNKYICRVDVLIEDNRLLAKEKTSFLNTLFKFHYPAVNNSEEVIGYIEVCPSFAMLDKLLADRLVLTVMLASVIFLLLIISFMFYFYIRRYILLPFNQIKTIIENLFKNNKMDFNRFNGPGIWKDISVKLNKLNNKVFDMDTVMNLLLSVASINGSELELINSVQYVFDIIRTRIPVSKCVLLVSEKNQLKVIAKRGFFKKNVSFISGDSKNYIWDCYKNLSDKIINDVSDIDKNKLSDLCDGMESGSFACFSLIDGNIGSCVGVFVITTDIKGSFSYDLINTIKMISKYFVLLINKTVYHQKIEELKARLEAEGQFAIKELVSKNELVTKRMKNINAVLDIFSFVLKKIEISKVADVKDIIEFIIEKAKETFGVKHAGILAYDKNKKELSSMYNSFGLKKEIKFINKKNSIYGRILETGKGVFLSTNDEAEKYIKTKLFETVNYIYSAIFLPIRDKNDEIIAFFGLVNKIDDEFNAIDMRFSEYIALIISGILNNKN